MRIELSPGDAAGVLACVEAHIEDERHEADRVEGLGAADEARDMRESCDDLARVARSLREQIANGGA
jgi:hypothetical protein